MDFCSLFPTYKNSHNSMLVKLQHIVNNHGPARYWSTNSTGSFVTQLKSQMLKLLKIVKIMEASFEKF